MNNEKFVLKFKYKKNRNFLNTDYINIEFFLQTENNNSEEFKKLGELSFKRILKDNSSNLKSMLDIESIKDYYEYNEENFSQKYKDEILSVPNNYIYLIKFKVDCELETYLISSMILSSFKILTKGLDFESWIGLKYKNGVIYDLYNQKLEMEIENSIFKVAGFKKLPDIDSNEISIISDKILRNPNAIKKLKI